MKKIKILFFALLIFVACNDKNGNGDEHPAGLPGNFVKDIYIADDGIKYFATDKGIGSFDGVLWKVFHKNPKIPTKGILALDFEPATGGPRLWLGSSTGVVSAKLPIDNNSSATLYNKALMATMFPGQIGLLGDTIFSLKVDDKNIRWFGTEGGLSAFRGNKWPTIDFAAGEYHANFFKHNRITSFDYRNDTVYIGTMGGGIARMVTSSPDAISGASPYETPWSMIPTQNITAVFIDGNTQWYGSDNGLGKHVGTEAKGNWDLFYTDDGLVNNYIQAINKDKNGNLWIGTRGGVSKMTGGTFSNYTTVQGLVSNNVLCIAIDKDGTIWFGTDKGVSHFNGTTFTNFQAVN